MSEEEEEEEREKQQQQQCLQMGLLAQEDEQQREDRLDGEGCEERTERRLGEDASQQVGVLGVFTGGLKASAGGISAALIFGYLASLFFHPQMKK